MKPLKITTAEMHKLDAEIRDSARSVEYRNSQFDKLRKAGRAFAADVEAALEAVNGKAQSFTVTDFGTVADVALGAERKLAARGVTQRNRVGAVVIYRPAGPNANAYKNSAISTRITLKRVSGGWRLVGVERDTVYPKTPAKMDIRISEAARDDAIRAALADFKVMEDERVAA